MNSTKKTLGKKVFDKKDIRQNKIRPLMIFRHKIRPDDIRRAVLAPLSMLNNLIHRIQ
jgi:hypothetical protein